MLPDCKKKKKKSPEQVLPEYELSSLVPLKAALEVWPQKFSLDSYSDWTAACTTTVLLRSRVKGRLRLHSTSPAAHVRAVGTPASQSPVLRHCGLPGEAAPLRSPAPPAGPASPSGAGGQHPGLPAVNAARLPRRVAQSPPPAPVPPGASPAAAASPGPVRHVTAPPPRDRPAGAEHAHMRAPALLYPTARVRVPAPASRSLGALGDLSALCATSGTSLL